MAAAIAAAFLCLWPGSPDAGLLQVSPVGVEVPSPGATATLTLRNGGTDPLNAQIRVYRWSQVDGEEKLEPTEDVVASPPIVTLSPNTDYTVRLVRVGKRPVAAGESYRLLVDELPEPKGQQSSAVTLVMRYSIPVFFYPRNVAAGQLGWSIEKVRGRIYVTAVNNGDRHVRIAGLTLRDANGQTASFGKGLTGYVLGRSAMRWAAPFNTSRLNLAQPIAISAQGDIGLINVSTPVRHMP